MRSLPSALSSELVKEAHSIGHLIELDFSPTFYRYTDKDMDVIYSGNTYIAKGIEFDSAQFTLLPRVDSLSFEIDNVDLAFSSLVMTTETRGRACTIYRAAFDEYLQVIAQVVLFTGKLDSVEVNKDRAKFEVFNDFIRWNLQTPRREHMATCFWTFKGTECGYAGGETWCDHSYDRCSALSNTVSFGGFRWLPALQDKKISWGKLPV